MRKSIDDLLAQAEETKRRADERVKKLKYQKQMADAKKAISDYKGLKAKFDVVCNQNKELEANNKKLNDSVKKFNDKLQDAIVKVNGSKAWNGTDDGQQVKLVRLDNVVQLMQNINK